MTDARGQVDETPITVTVNRAAALSGVCTRTILRAIEAGTLKSTTIGRRRLIYFSSLKQMLDSGAPGRAA